jgi:hypothetical protein
MSEGIYFLRVYTISHVRIGYIGGRVPLPGDGA